MPHFKYLNMLLKSAHVDSSDIDEKGSSSSDVLTNKVSILLYVFNMNVIKEISSITRLELSNGIYGGKEGSWHNKYRDSAWVYVGGLSYELTEGDIICFMSQWGEIEDINLVRDKATNKSLGYAFLKYENQKSTILAVDNFNGITLLKRTLRVDHVERYKLPKDIRDKENELLEENPDGNTTTTITTTTPINTMITNTITIFSRDSPRTRTCLYRKGAS